MNDRTRRRKVLALAKQQGWQCFWCGGPMVDPERECKGGKLAAHHLTLDHVYPKGVRDTTQPHTRGLAVAACHACNDSHSATPFMDFAKKVTRWMGWQKPWQGRVR